MIQVQDLWWKYEAGQQYALKGINTEIDKGEFVAIVGPNDHGKSTLCMCMNGLIPHAFRGEIKGNLEVAGIDTIHSDIPTISTKVGTVLQNPESQFVQMTVVDNIVFGPENLGISPEEIKRRVGSLTKLTRTEGLLERTPDELSGGQKQRVAIASALAMTPEILILDEPTSELDPVGKTEVFSLLGRLKREANLTVVLVSHLMEEIVKYADRVMLLYEGKIELDAPPAEFFSNGDYLADKGVELPQVTEAGYLFDRSKRLLNAYPLTLESAYNAFRNVLTEGR